MVCFFFWLSLHSLPAANPVCAADIISGLISVRQCRVFSVTGGHYTAYCQNVINGQWYEFDDQYVTEVHETVVQNAEAYVLFYR